MKPETRLMADIFGERITGPKDTYFHDNVQGRSLREVFMTLLDDIGEMHARHNPQFSRIIKPMILVIYGFDGPAKKLKEVGEMFDITGERVRVYQWRALRMLKHPSRSRQLRPFLKHCD